MNYENKNNSAWGKKKSQVPSTKFQGTANVVFLGTWNLEFGTSAFSGKGFFIDESMPQVRILT
ncbi:MAG: hypothetical protein HY841_02215 [Bacteroidetes bacterium]|nr:hypothetical protein [Bacteroidota bacterium]